MIELHSCLHMKKNTKINFIKVFFFMMIWTVVLGGTSFATDVSYTGQFLVNYAKANSGLIIGKRVSPDLFPSGNMSLNAFDFGDLSQCISQAANGLTSIIFLPVSPPPAIPGACAGLGGISFRISVQPVLADTLNIMADQMTVTYAYTEGNNPNQSNPLRGGLGKKANVHFMQFANPIHNPNFQTPVPSWANDPILVKRYAPCYNAVLGSGEVPIPGAPGQNNPILLEDLNGVSFNFQNYCNTVYAFIGINTLDTTTGITWPSDAEVFSPQDRPSDPIGYTGVITVTVMVQ